MSCSSPSGSRTLPGRRARPRPSRTRAVDLDGRNAEQPRLVRGRSSTRRSVRAHAHRVVRRHACPAVRASTRFHAAPRARAACPGLADQAHGDRRVDRRAVLELLHLDAWRPGTRRSVARSESSSAGVRLRVERLQHATNSSADVAASRCRGRRCSRSAGCRARRWRTRRFTSGRALSTRSTKRTARSVSARLAPSGVSTVTRNCGVPALGNRLKPTTGHQREAAREQQRPRRASVRRGRASARCSTRRIGRARCRGCSRRRNTLPCSSRSVLEQHGWPGTA